MIHTLVHGFTQSERSWDPIHLDHAVALRVPDDLDFVSTASALADTGGHATYVGYSMGGRLCLQLALDHPDVVDRLVLASASPGIADDRERAARRDSDEALARGVERDGVDAFLERWLAQPMFATLPRERGRHRRTATSRTAWPVSLTSCGHWARARSRTTGAGWASCRCRFC